MPSHRYPVSTWRRKCQTTMILPLSISSFKSMREGRCRFAGLHGNPQHRAEVLCILSHGGFPSLAPYRSLSKIRCSGAHSGDALTSRHPHLAPFHRYLVRIYSRHLRETVEWGSDGCAWLQRGWPMVLFETWPTHFGKDDKCAVKIDDLICGRCGRISSPVCAHVRRTCWTRQGAETRIVALVWLTQNQSSFRNGLRRLGRKDWSGA